MTDNEFSGMLNLTQSINQYVEITVFCSQGEVEEELKAMDFPSLFIYRPA